MGGASRSRIVKNVILLSIGWVIPIVIVSVIGRSSLGRMTRPFVSGLIAYCVALLIITIMVIWIYAESRIGEARLEVLSWKWLTRLLVAMVAAPLIVRYFAGVRLPESGLAALYVIVVLVVLVLWLALLNRRLDNRR